MPAREGKSSIHEKQDQPKPASSLEKHKRKFEDAAVIDKGEITMSYFVFEELARSNLNIWKTG